jgi:hypothetical protein
MFLKKLIRVVQLIPALVMGVEGMFGKGEGKSKKAAVLDGMEMTIGVAEAVANRDIIDEKAFREGLEMVNEGYVKIMNATVWKK